jgi:hypothetical protein
MAYHFFNDALRSRPDILPTSGSPSISNKNKNITGLYEDNAMYCCSRSEYMLKLYYFHILKDLLNESYFWQKKGGIIIAYKLTNQDMTLHFTIQTVIKD